LFVDDFEAGTHGWTGGSLSSESVVTGGHSYKAESNNRTIIKNVNIRSGKSYTLSFWAKANSTKNEEVKISFNNDSNFIFNSSGSLDFSNTWKCGLHALFS